MSHRVMLVLAALLAIGAAVMLFYGTRLGGREATIAEVVEPPQPEPVKEYDVVAAAADLPRGHVIVAEDLKRVRITGEPGARYLDEESLVGEITRMPVAAETFLEPRHLVEGGRVARMLHPGERAVAVKVDEVIGTGGFIQPEDYVDVLLYLRGNFEDVNQSQSQVVLRKVRVLAFGEDLIEEEAAAQAPPPQPESAQEKPGGARAIAAAAMPSQEKERKETGKKSRSAVLAVREPEATRLMLAESAGALRLALLPTQEGAVEPAPQEAAQAAGAPAIPVAQTQAEREAAARRVLLADLLGGRRSAAAPSGGRSAAPVVVIHRGDQVERAAVAR